MLVFRGDTLLKNRQVFSLTVLFLYKFLIKMYHFCACIFIYFFIIFSMVSEASTCQEILSTLRFTNKKTPVTNQLTMLDQLRALMSGPIYQLYQSMQQQQKLGNYIKYASREGQILFAIEKFGGDMGKAYHYVQQKFHHDPTWKNKIGWREFYGTVQDFYQLKNELMVEITESEIRHQNLFGGAKERMLFLINQAKYIKKEYIGIRGQAYLAINRYKGNMQKAYVNGVAVFGEKVIKDIGWEKDFEGILIDFQTIWTWLTDTQGHINRNYISNDGLRLFAREYYNGNVRRAYVNVLAVLTDSQFNQLQWDWFAIYYIQKVQPPFK